MTNDVPYPLDGSGEQFKWSFGLGRHPVAVYGLGKMGLPLAGVFAEASGNVVGVDIDPDVADSVNDGECPVEREPGLDDLVAETVGRDELRATTDVDAAADTAEIHVVIVPTPVDDENSADLSAVEAVVRSIGRGLSPGDFVAIECTVPPRTCEDVVLPTLTEESGLDAGEFGLAFCPERTKSGQALRDIRGSYPKIVGGVDDESTAVAEAMYEEINDSGVVTVSDATTAEAVKVFEGVYRDVNIALANELATLQPAFDIDVTEAIEAANTQPFCHILTPGAGVGGHCIPYYPYFVIDRYDRGTPLLRTARAVNDTMPEFAVDRLVGELDALDVDPSDATVAVFGLTYRPGVNELAATPALPVAKRLAERGATVLGVDPMLDDDDVASFPLDLVDLEAVFSHDVDGVVLVTAHDEFETVDWDALDDSLAVVDGRQALDLDETHHEVYTIGGG